MKMSATATNVIGEKSRLLDEKLLGSSYLIHGKADHIEFQCLTIVPQDKRPTADQAKKLSFTIPWSSVESVYRPSSILSYRIVVNLRTGGEYELVFESPKDTLQCARMLEEAGKGHAEFRIEMDPAWTYAFPSISMAAILFLVGSSLYIVTSTLGIGIKNKPMLDAIHNKFGPFGLLMLFVLLGSVFLSHALWRISTYKKHLGEIEHTVDDK